MSDKPTIEYIYFTSGEIAQERHVVNNKTSILIDFYLNGNKKHESYYVDGIRHREDRPAYISYWNSGSVCVEKYIYNGMHHRLDGPAIIYYYQNKYEIKKCLYYINDRLIECNSDEEFKKIVKLMMFK